MARENISSGSPYEDTIGFSRAVKIGRVLAVSGTAPIAGDGSTEYPGDLYNQTRSCLRIIQKAVEKVGGGLDSIIRTRVFLTDISRWEEAARAHGEIFGKIKPACTFVEVSRFVREDWLVEIEADCVLSDE